MSDHKADNHTDAAAAATTSTPHAPAPAAGHDAGKLTDLMAHGDKGKAPASRGPDLEQQAMRAAEQALAEGERALATARAQLQQETPAATKKSSRRELALRVLLAVNVLAMVVVALLPAPGSSTTTKPVVRPDEHATGHEKVAPAPRTDELWVAAMAASSRHDYAAAVTLLERYLAESPRMAPSTQMAVLTALAYSASKANDWKRAQDYQRRARALEQSHSLPEDLVAMAKAAAETGDQDSLRRVWARFLLQQQQIPSSLYQHVANAYLQLGDSYRNEANAAAEKARLAELAETERRLREEALKGKGEPK